MKERKARVETRREQGKGREGKEGKVKGGKGSDVMREDKGEKARNGAKKNMETLKKMH